MIRSHVFHTQVQVNWGLLSVCQEETEVNHCFLQIFNAKPWFLIIMITCLKNIMYELIIQ